MNEERDEFQIVVVVGVVFSVYWYSELDFFLLFYYFLFKFV